MQENKDLVVLGGGPGGYVAAIKASQLGRKVTLVEKESLGGVCLNWGCIPSKALLKSAHLFHDMKRAEEFGFEVDGLKFDFPKIISRSRDVAGKLSAGVTYLMKKNNVEVVKGTGKLLGGNNLEVTSSTGNKTLNYKDIVIATGASPRTIPNIEIDGDVFHTSRTILEHKRLPQKLLVIGAGAIGMEFAYFFSSLGVQVTVVEMMSQILPPEDTEIANELEKIFKKKGMIIKTATKVEEIKKNGKTASANLVSATETDKWSGDTILFAIGVVANTSNIGLETVGIAVDRGFVKTDNFMRTNVPNHFAIGDIVGVPQLAHKASHEGIVASEAACGILKHPMKYDNIPGCTYCQPQVASIGLTERAVKEKGIKYKIGKIPFQAIGKAIAIGEPEGMTKVIIAEDTGEVLGVHILHSEATELISEAVVIRTHEGIATSVIDTIHPHPTLSESIMEAFALANGTPINY